MKIFNGILIIISMSVFCSCGHKLRCKEENIDRKNIEVVLTSINIKDSIIMKVKEFIICDNLIVPVISDTSPFIKLRINIKNNTSKDVVFCTYCKPLDSFFYYDNSFYGIKNKDTIKFGVDKYEKKTLAREINFKNGDYFRRYIVKSNHQTDITVEGYIRLRSLPKLKNGDNLKEILTYLRGYRFYFIPHYVDASYNDKNANVIYLSKQIVHITPKTKFKTDNYKNAEIWVRRQRQGRRY